MREGFRTSRPGGVQVLYFEVQIADFSAVLPDVAMSPSTGHASLLTRPQ